jgi:phosphatidylinositol kinase/protein kinase (PI-3  family)
LGVEGHFRVACENTLRVIRNHKEILIMLLEAFIFDPLVDWRSEGSPEKRILNLNANIGLLSSRVGINIF